MPATNGQFTGAIPGLTLRAWALVSGAGALLSGFNVSGAVRNSVGNFTVNFTAAIPSANTIVERRALFNALQATESVGSTCGTNLVNVTTYAGGVLTDPATFYVAVYG